MNDEKTTSSMNAARIFEEFRSTPVPKRAKYQSIEEFKAAFAPPVTMGQGHAKARSDVIAAFDSAGGYESLYSSYNTLVQHAVEMGQYPMSGFVGYSVLQSIQQNGMIQNCIKTVADDVTREWIKLTGGDAEDGGERLEKLDRLQLDKYRLKTLINQAQAMVGFMGGAFIFIDTCTDDHDSLRDPLRLNSESEELTGEGAKVRFRLIDPVTVCPINVNCSQPLDADFMKPQSWLVQGVEVHSSRLIPLVDNEPPTMLKPSYNFLGIPQAQILWDYVLHWNECRTAGVELLKKISLIVYKTDAKDRFMQPGGVHQLDLQIEALQRYRDNDSIFVIDKNDSVENVQTSVGGISDVVKLAQECIAAINRTPAVKLFGISPSGFNATGESDIRNYYDHIKSKQELKRDAIQKMLNVIQLVEFGDIDPSVGFTFNDLAQDDIASDAMTFATKVNALTALKDRNIITGEEMRQVIKLEESLGLSFLSDDYDPDEVDEEGDDLQTDNPLAGFLEAMGGGSKPEGGMNGKGENVP